jgi:hypothetical protein
MVAVAGQVHDDDLRVWKGFGDKPFDLGTSHCHFLSLLMLSAALMQVRNQPHRLLVEVKPSSI